MDLRKTPSTWFSRCLWKASMMLKGCMWDDFLEEGRGKAAWFLRLLPNYLKTNWNVLSQDRLL